ncbi:MAG: BACON domain-containing carbohydrate-binding protein, partial [Bacteroidota bacterium]
MKKIVHYSLNLIIALAMVTMFTESSLAFNRNIKMSDATQADAIVVSKTNITFGVAASTDTFSITSAVSWVITSNQTWLTVTPTSGSNNGVVYVAATANTGTAARSGTITIVAASTLTGTNVAKTVLVTQAAQTPTTTLNVSRTSISLSSYNACADTFAITSNASWTLTLSSTTSGTGIAPTWLTVTPTAGTNNAIINVAAVANTTTTARYAVVIVTSGNISKSVVISQAAAPVSTLNVSRTTIALPTYNACADTFAITSNVNWTIAINGGTNSATIPTWLTATPTSGSNNAVVNIAAVANTTTAARTAYVVVSSGTLSKTITVTQAAAPIPVSYLNVSRTSIALPTYNACADTFAVTSNVTWTVTISGVSTPGGITSIPTWLTVTPTSGANNAVINVAAVANTTTTARTAYIVVTSGNLSKTVLVTQPAAPVSYLNVSRTIIALPTYNACADTFAITSNVAWTIAINGGSNTTTIPT